MTTRLRRLLGEATGTDQLADVVFSTSPEDTEWVRGVAVSAEHPRLGRVGFVHTQELNTKKPWSYAPDIPDPKGADLLPAGWADFDALRTKIGKRNAGVFYVAGSWTHRIFRGDKLGTKLYQIAAKAVADKGAILVANAAHEEGATSASALRVWKLLSRFMPVIGLAAWGGGLNMTDLMKPVRGRTHGFLKDRSDRKAPPMDAE